MCSATHPPPLRGRRRLRPNGLRLCERGVPGGKVAILIGHPRLQFFAYPDFRTFWHSFGTHPLSASALSVQTRVSVCPIAACLSARAASLPHGKVDVGPKLPKAVESMYSGYAKSLQMRTANALPDLYMPLFLKP